MIQTVADLGNTIIAVNINRAIDEVVVPPLVVKYGADPRGIKFIPIPFPEMFAALNRGEVEAFCQAMIAAAEFANTNPQETRNILGKYISLDRNILDTVVLPLFITGSLNRGLLEETIDQMRQASWLKAQFTAEDLLLQNPVSLNLLTLIC